jgi:hypothetical protein
MFFIRKGDHTGVKSSKDRGLISKEENLEVGIAKAMLVVSYRLPVADSIASFLGGKTLAQEALERGERGVLLQVIDNSTIMRPFGENMGTPEIVGLSHRGI